MSYWSQPQLDVPAIFIYDGHAGGAALAEQGWDIVGPWLDAVEELLRDCPCEEGCPACIQSPKCGNGNKPLDKGGAKELVRRLKARLAQAGDTGVTITPPLAMTPQTAGPLGNPGRPDPNPPR